MGKYMRKAKAAGEVAVMEVSPASLGVRTRAKTLALQRLQKTASSPGPASSGSYLQLRSRRLEKPPIVAPSQEAKKPKQQQQQQQQQQEAPKLGCVQQNPKANSNSRQSSRLRRVGPVASGSRGSVSIEQRVKEESGGQKAEEAKEMTKAQHDEQVQGINNGDLGIEEASFGENVLEFEGRERSTRESTPCSLIRDPDTIRTPGSTTRATNSAETNRRIQNSSQRHIPTAHEMDEFFAGAEVEQQKQFIDKYNFDPVNDKPLPGRYEWEKVDS